MKYLKKKLFLSIFKHKLEDETLRVYFPKKILNWSFASPFSKQKLEDWALRVHCFKQKHDDVASQIIFFFMFEVSIAGSASSEGAYTALVSPSAILISL